MTSTGAGAAAVLARGLAAVYAVCGVVAVWLLATGMPPFQNADEASNFLRADQVSRGGLLPTRYDAFSGGGVTEPNIVVAAEAGEALKFHPERKVDPAGLARQRALPWTTPYLQTFANTAIYPPVFYLPAAVATGVGRALGWPVVRTLVLARVVSGVVGVALGTLAVGLAGGAAPWIFVLLSLPISLAQMAAVTHDGLAIASAALAAAAIASAIARGETSWRRLVAVTLLLVLLATDRPPMAILAFFLWLLPGLARRIRCAAIAVVWFACLAWSAYVAPLTGALTRGEIAPAAQWRFVLAHPSWMLTVAHQTLRRSWRNYVGEFVGRLGWLDTAIPHWLHVVAWIALALAVVIVRRGRLGGWPRGTVIGLAAIAATAGAIFFIQYLTWTKVGAEAVEGVQGRYFIPIALFLAALLPAFPPYRPTRLVVTGMCLLAVFPVLSIIATHGAVLSRYYGAASAPVLPSGRE